MGGRISVVPEERSLRQWGGDEARGCGPALPARCRTVVWNLHKQSKRGFDEAWARLADRGDLLLLQEVYLMPGAKARLAERGHSCTLAAQLEYADGSPAGTALLARVPALPESIEAQVTPDLEPMVGTPKSAALAQFALPSGPPLLCCSIHGINRAPFEAFERQLGRVVARLQQHTGPVLLAGDFNTQTEAKVACLEAAAATLELRAVAFDPDLRTPSKLSRRPLDHAFVSTSVRIEAQEVVVGGSDHAALTFDLIFE